MIIDIPDKICPHCGGSRWKLEYDNRGLVPKPRYRCPKQADERRVIWKLKNPDKVKIHQETRNTVKRESGFYDTDEYRKYQLEKWKESSAAMDDRYIRYLLTKDISLDIPQDLIELKRKQLKLIRKWLRKA